MSAHNPGQWWAGNGTVTMNRGGKLLYLIHVGQLEKVQDARRAVQHLPLPRVGWTVGGIARTLLAWIGPPQRIARTALDRVRGLDYGYRYCEPGVFSNGLLVDLNAAFWQAVQRLPSLRVTWGPGRPYWHPLTADETARWSAVKDALGECKTLRNTLIGCMIGGGGEARCYCKGERLRMPKRAGPFPAAGWTVSRAIYELTALQRMNAGACYANTDNLIVPRGTRLEVWDRYGYLYRELAQGRAEVYRIGCYRVGNQATYWFSAGSRYPVPVLSAPLPSRWTLTEWH